MTDSVPVPFPQCSGEGFEGQGHKVTKRTGSVAMFDSHHRELRSWKFRNAMPVRWSGPSLAASSSTLAVEELEVSHGGFTV